ERQPVLRRAPTAEPARSRGLHAPRAVVVPRAAAAHRIARCAPLARPRLLRSRRDRRELPRSRQPAAGRRADAPRLRARARPARARFRRRVGGEERDRRSDVGRARLSAPRSLVLRHALVWIRTRGTRRATRNRLTRAALLRYSDERRV